MTNDTIRGDKRSDENKAYIKICRLRHIDVGNIESRNGVTRNERRE